MFQNHRWIQGEDANFALASFLYNTTYPDLKHQLKQKGGEHMDKNVAKLNKYIQINQSSVILTKVMENLPVSKQEFNTNPYLIGFNNGILDLKKLVTDKTNIMNSFRKAEPADYVTMSVGYDFEVLVEDPDDKLDKFFTTSVPNEADHQLLMEILASSLDGIGYERFFMFNGEGGNGKSIIFQLMAIVLGDYCLTAKNAVLKDFAKANESSGDLLDLKAKRMILFEELGDLNNNVIKNFTGGVPVTARALYKSNETFKLSATTIASYNQRPDIINTTGGNSDFRRYIDLFFSVNFTDKAEKIGPTKQVGNQTITWAIADNKYSSGEWREKVKLAMLFKLLLWYQKSFDDKANCIQFNVPVEAVNRVTSFIDDQNHFHRIFNEYYIASPESKTHIYLSALWEKIQYDDTYMGLSIKIKKRFGRKAFYEWLQKSFTVDRDSANVMYIIGAIER